MMMTLYSFSAKNLCSMTNLGSSNLERRETQGLYMACNSSKNNIEIYERQNSKICWCKQAYTAYASRDTKRLIS